MGTFVKEHPWMTFFIIIAIIDMIIMGFILFSGNYKNYTDALNKALGKEESQGRIGITTDEWGTTYSYK